MASIRRFYIYLVSAISLQAVTWATIALLRNLLVRSLNSPVTAMAFEISVLIIGLPVFLIHWLWAQRLASRQVEERDANLRRFYLYATLAGFLGPFTANSYDFFGSLLRASGALSRQPNPLSTGSALLYHLVALLVLGLFWFYHTRILAGDTRDHPETGNSATLRRMYLLGFSTTGLAVTSQGLIDLLRLILLGLFQSTLEAQVNHAFSIKDAVIRLGIGLPLWLVFWVWAQRLFTGPLEGEHESALRKFYLYGAVFAGVLGTVGYTTIVLAGIFRRLLRLEPEGDIRLVAPVILVMAVVWAYHAFVLRQDARRIAEAPRQAGIRRLYLYLVAGIGLAALLVGLSGDLTVLLQSLQNSFGSGLKEQLAWFTAAILAGLPVWLLSWGQLQKGARQSDEAGRGERQSLVRKIYLYVFLFLAMMAVLASLVNLLYNLLSTLFGEPPPTWVEQAQMMAYLLIGAVVLVYHALTLNQDSRLARQELAKQLSELRVVFLSGQQVGFVQAVASELHHSLPDLAVEIAAPTPESVGLIIQAGLLLCPAELLLPGGAPGEVLQALANSPGRKLLAPAPQPGWDWAGLDRWSQEALVHQAAKAVEQVVNEEPVRAVRPIHIGVLLMVIIGGLFMFSVVAGLVANYIAMGF